MFKVSIFKVLQAHSAAISQKDHKKVRMNFRIFFKFFFHFFIKKWTFLLHLDLKTDKIGKR